jgi:hypothetical protein
MFRGEVNLLWGSRSESESEEGVICLEFSRGGVVAGCGPEAG